MNEFVIGEILSIGGGCLAVFAEGTTLREDRIWVNPDLLVGADVQLGDRVVLLTSDRQVYYLICKAVRYG